MEATVYFRTFAGTGMPENHQSKRILSLLLEIFSHIL